MTTHTLRTARSYRVFGLVIGLCLLVLGCLLSVWFGSKDIPFGSTWDVLWHNDGSRDAAIIHSVRIPRTILGLLHLAQTDPDAPNAALLADEATSVFLTTHRQ
ncbi:hypothetical protein ACFQ1S_08255 [Kibdelosporangium lantanae]|uniref:Uncharacterized protein n=1 Tax=Kibdelosporangium lantanae TaxID=1497396 RepID=A0ABW3M7H1_9PSEU